MTDLSQLFVIYNVETGLRMGGMYREKTYSTRGAAQSVLTKKIKSGKAAADKFAVTDLQNYMDNIDGFVEVKNMMSGKPVKLRRSEVGTCVDPSTERYWTM